MVRVGLPGPSWLLQFQSGRQVRVCVRVCVAVPHCTAHLFLFQQCMCWEFGLIDIIDTEKIPVHVKSSSHIPQQAAECC